MTNHGPLTREMINLAPFEELPTPGLNGVAGNGRGLLDDGENGHPVEIPLSDTYNAKLLVRNHGHRIRHCGRWQRWMVYNTGIWAEDHDKQLVEIAKTTMFDLLEQARQMLDKIDAAEEMAGDHADPKVFEGQRKETKTLVEHVRRSLGRRKLEDMITLAQSEAGIPISPDHFDQHPMLLPVANGVVDLQTGELLPHSQDYLFTRKLDVAYNKDAACPKWERAISEIMGAPLGEDSPEFSAVELEARHEQHQRAERLVTFLKRSLGYMLTGDVREQLLWLFVGNGNNGKSIILDTMLSLFGEFGYKATQSLFMTKQYESHPTETASLFGRRLVALNETQQGGKLNSSFIKDATGSDRMTARRMRENPWTFPITHHLIMCTNHLPIIDDPSHGMWRRLRLVPFTVKFIDPNLASEKELNDSKLPKQNKNLLEELRQELPGILCWLVEGCIAWCKEGLTLPPEVLFATEAYRRESNSIEAFVKEGCLVGPSYQSRASELFERYEHWCKQNEQESCDRRSFGKQMVALGHEAKKSNGRRIYTGIAARDIESDEDEYIPSRVIEGHDRVIEKTHVTH